METDVMKGGEKVLWMKIAQMKDSVHLHLKAHPMVETFFRELSGGKEDSVSGRGGGYWFGVDNKELKVYRLNPAGMSYSGPGYGLDADGFQLNTSDNGNGPFANLAFLRLKGISDPDGVKLGVHGVMSLSARRQLKDATRSGMSRFVRDYLIPVTIELDIRVDERVDDKSRISLS